MNPAAGAHKVRSTQYQLGILVEQLEANRALACGIFTEPMGYQNQEAQWEEVAKNVSEYGPTKTAKQCKSSWRDLKRKVRTKNAIIKQDRQRNTNNANVPQLTELEAKVLTMIRPQSSLMDNVASQSQSHLDSLPRLPKAEMEEAVMEEDNVASQSQSHLDSLPRLPKAEMEEAVMEESPIRGPGVSKRPGNAPTSTKAAKKKMDFLDVKDFAKRYPKIHDKNYAVFTDISSSLKRLASAQEEFAEATKQRNKIEAQKNKIKLLQIKMSMKGSQDQDMQEELDKLYRLC